MLDFITTQTKKKERSDEILNTLVSLRQGYEDFIVQQKLADNKLYSVLEGCLDFYYFLQTSDAHAIAFKNMCDFKFKADTKLVLLISKAVFGKDNKQHYAYAKALDNAVEAEVGKDENNTMAEWLRKNGGVNGAIRISQKNTNTDIISDFGEYILSMKYGHERIEEQMREQYTFNSKHLCQTVDRAQRYDCFLYVTVDRSGEKVKIQHAIFEEDYVKRMYKLLQQYVGTNEDIQNKWFEEYKGIRLKQAEEADEQTEEVAEYLKKIASALK
jgi:hypothetical protein